MQLKKAKSHTSTRKKASKSTPRGTKKAASMALKPAKLKAAKEKEKLAALKREKKLEELTLRAFRMAYEDYQKHGSIFR